jgi:hypothetical protein
MELVLLGRLFGECHNLFFGVSLILRKRHPFANDFSARLVVFHVRGSFGSSYLGQQGASAGRCALQFSSHLPKIGAAVTQHGPKVSGLLAAALVPVGSVLHRRFFHAELHGMSSLGEQLSFTIG